jgi:hypothetical protein
MVRRALVIVGCLALLASACGGAYRAQSPPTMRRAAGSYGGAPARAEAIVVAEASPAPGYYAADDDGGGSAPAGPAPVSPSVTADKKEMIVVEGYVTVGLDDVAGGTTAIRARVEGAGGKVMDEGLSGSSPGSTYGTMRVRLPPAAVDDFLAWLATQGDIEERRITGTDVTRQYHDRELALENLRLTMDRLQKLLDRADLDMKSVLEIERELTRVRGAIEQLEGEQRFLRDRVDFATLDITLRPRRGAVFAPDAAFHPGPQITTLTLVDAGDRRRTRLGYGVELHFARAFTADLSVFPSVDGEPRAVVTTVGMGLYSEYLGNGKRAFLNPYLGLRAGYAHLDDASHLYLGGEAGVELYKHEYVLVDAFFRTAALLGQGGDFVLQGGLAVAFPF